MACRRNRRRSTNFCSRPLRGSPRRNSGRWPTVMRTARFWRRSWSGISSPGSSTLVLLEGSCRQRRRCGTPPAHLRAALRGTGPLLGRSRAGDAAPGWRRLLPEPARNSRAETTLPRASPAQRANRLFVRVRAGRRVERRRGSHARRARWGLVGDRGSEAVDLEWIVVRLRHRRLSRRRQPHDGPGRS